MKIKLPKEQKPPRTGPGWKPVKEAGTSVADQIPFLLFLASLLLVAMAPRFWPASEFAGTRLMSDTVGYKAIVDRMAAMGLFRIEALPAREGVPERQVVVLDRAALDRARAAGTFGSCQTEGFLTRIKGALGRLFAGGQEGGDDACERLFNRFKSATFLADDMERASPDLWEIERGRITGIRNDAHALRESGYARQASRATLDFAPGSGIAGERWTLVNPADGLATPLVGSGGTACRGLPFGSGVTGRCFDQTVLIDTGGTDLLVNGRMMAEGAQGSLVALRSGDMIGLAGPDGRIARSWQLLRQPAALSRVAPNGQRVRDPFFANLALQIDTGLDASVQTSIRQDLQRITETWLRRTLWPKTAEEPARSIRGAILLMDGMSGEIAAAASYPSEKKELAAREQTTPSRMRWLRLNQNFETLLVGSSAKVPFAAAIAKADPALLAFTTDYADNHCMSGSYFLATGQARRAANKGECLTRFKGAWLPDHPNGSPRVDFQSFIAYSNNFYAMSLLRRAWRETRDNPDRGTWLYNLRWLACADEIDHKPTRGSHCPAFLWRDEKSAERGQPLGGLRLTFPERLTEPYSQLLLATTGGGNFQWATPQLAQAYARIITGQPVAPRLTGLSDGERSMLAANHREDPFFTGAVWTNVMAGMHRVITEGTAHALAPMNGDNLFAPGAFLYGKTGTPTVVAGNPSKDGSVFVLAVVHTRTNRPPMQPADVCALRIMVVNLQTDTSAVALTRTVIQPRGPVRDWLARPCPGRPAA